LVLSWAIIGPSWAEGPGPAIVLGSDALMLNGTIFRFNGLDGVEFHQSCFVDGKAWACGASATRALQTLLEGIMVTCTPTGERSGDGDFAVCASDQGDIGETMVRQGWAMANPSQSDAYVAAEQAARENGEGIWRGLVLEPWAFRQDIAAIEHSYIEQAGASILAEAEQALATDSGVGIFADTRIGTLEPDESVETSDQEVRIDVPAAGFVLDAIESRDVFRWQVVSRVLEDWRRSAVGFVVSGGRRPIWEGLMNRPVQLDTVNDEEAYYRAIGKGATPLIEQGRQPVLIVTSPLLPDWIGYWFAGRPPQGALITRKTDIDRQGYMGTIDGIDVYVGPTPGTDSLLLPDDLLTAANYRENADGAVLAFERNSDGANDEFVFRYAIALEWKPDVVVWLHFPYEDNE